MYNDSFAKIYSPSDISDDVLPRTNIYFLEGPEWKLVRKLHKAQNRIQSDHYILRFLFEGDQTWGCMRPCKLTIRIRYHGSFEDLYKETLKGSTNSWAKLRDRFGITSNMLSDHGVSFTEFGVPSDNKFKDFLKILRSRYSDSDYVIDLGPWNRRTSIKELESRLISLGFGKPLNGN